MDVILKETKLIKREKLSFKVLLHYADEGMDGAFEPLANTTRGEDFVFSLVFWGVKKPIPERPISPYYDFYKLILRSSD